MSRCLLIALCLALAPPAWAGPFAPGGDAATLARPFALPVLGDTAPLARGRAETRWTFDVTNEYVNEGDCAIECVTLDGETARVRFSHRRSLGDGWEVSFEVPFLDRGGGFLDGWIRDWHDGFGLPTGGRELAADDQYRFRYERGGVVLLDETRGGNGVGDTTLALGRRIGRASTLRAMVKLPTGGERALEGGNAGGALWVERPWGLPSGWNGYLALGASLNERGPVLPRMQNREVVFGGFGLLVPVTPWVRLSAQLQYHGRLYDGSELTPFARPGLPLTLGLQFGYPGRGTFELGFLEDPSVNGSPDFAAYLSFTRR